MRIQIICSGKWDDFRALWKTGELAWLVDDSCRLFKGNTEKANLQAWQVWCQPVISAFRRQSQEDCHSKFQSSRGSTSRPCLKTKQTLYTFSHKLLVGPKRCHKQSLSRKRRGATESCNSYLVASPRNQRGTLGSPCSSEDSSFTVPVHLLLQTLGSAGFQLTTKEIKPSERRMAIY